MDRGDNRADQGKIVLRLGEVQTQNRKADSPPYARSGSSAYDRICVLFCQGATTRSRDCQVSHRWQKSGYGEFGKKPDGAFFAAGEGMATHMLASRLAQLVQTGIKQS